MGGEPPLQAHEAQRILGVGPAVSGAPLRQAYLAAVKASHPDRPGGDAARLRAVVAAYLLLKTPSAAAVYTPSAPAPMVDQLVITPAEAMTGGTVIVDLRAAGRVSVTLPPGLRQGERVRVAGRIVVVQVRGQAGAWVLGDHLCLTVLVDQGILNHGGRVRVATPLGEQSLWVCRAAAAAEAGRASPWAAARGPVGICTCAFAPPMTARSSVHPGAYCADSPKPGRPDLAHAAGFR